MKYSEEAYKELLSKSLHKLSPRLISWLEALFARKLEPEIAQLHFEIHAMSLFEMLPIRVYFLNAHQSEVIPSEQVLEETAVMPAHLEDGFLELDEDGVNVFGHDAPALIQWFASQWQRAGGASSPLPAYISNHGETGRLDLKTGS